MGQPSRETGVVTDRGIWLVLAGAVLWGTTGTAQALGPEGSQPLMVGVLRLVVAAPALLALAWWRDALPRPGLVRWRPVFIAAVAVAGYQPAFFTAVDRTGVAVGTVVAIGSAPVITGGLSWLAGQERPGGRWWIATTLALAGLSMLTLANRGAGVDPAGLVFAVVAGLCFAVYLLATRQAIEGGTPLGSTAFVFSLAALISLPLLLVGDIAWVMTRTGVLMALHLALVATALAYALFTTGLRSTVAATAATAALAEPVTATLLGVTVLGERPGAIAWTGVALVMAGLVILVAARPDYRTVKR